MRKIRTNFYFDAKENVSRLIPEIVENELGFEAKYIAARNFSRTGGQYSAQSHLKKIRNSVDIGHLTLADDNENNCANAFRFISIADWFLTQLEWRVISKDIPREKAVLALTALSDFNVGYRNDDEDTYWQSADSIDTYEFYNRPHENLPRVIHPQWKEERIDISRNPGRSTFFPGMKLQAAWQMWFGPGFFKYVPCERLLSFEGAEKLTLLKTGVVFIQLYKSPSDCSLPKARKTQAAFRDWVGMDELEKQAFAIRDKKPHDPGVEIERGEFPHGGTAKIIHWLDDKGNLSTKSKAAIKLIIETGKDGREVWRNMEAL